jgi:aspartyl protease family protein
VQVREVKALVLKAGPKTSLLGMSYLGRLSRIEATPDSLILKR